MKKFQQIGQALLVSSTLIAQAALAQTVDTAKSQLNIVFKQMNMNVDAKFKKFQAAIQFDPAKVQNASARFDVDVKSFDMGDTQYNAEVAKPTWFNSAKFPLANFASTSIKPISGNQYEVTGKLNLKGKTADVKFPVTVIEQGSSRIFDGAFTIKRLNFNIGDGEWRDTGVVADEVVIKFKIHTNK